MFVWLRKKRAPSKPLVHGGRADSARHRRGGWKWSRCRWAGRTKALQGAYRLTVLLIGGADEQSRRGRREPQLPGRHGRALEQLRLRGRAEQEHGHHRGGGRHAPPKAELRLDQPRNDHHAPRGLARSHSFEFNVFCRSASLKPKLPRPRAGSPSRAPMYRLESNLSRPERHGHSNLTKSGHWGTRQLEPVAGPAASSTRWIVVFCRAEYFCLLTFAVALAHSPTPLAHLTRGTRPPPDPRA